MQGNVLALLANAMALLGDAMALLANAMALLADTMALLANAMALLADALTLQGVAKFNLLRINKTCVCQYHHIDAYRSHSHWGYFANNRVPKHNP